MLEIPFGGHAYIDASIFAKRDCSAQCACRRAATQQEKQVVFTASKTAQEIEVKIKSKTPWSWLQPILISEGECSMGDSSGVVNGLILLKHSDLLFHCFMGLEGLKFHKITSHQYEEIHFLISDFLGDSQIFQSLDCARLSELSISSTSCYIARLSLAFHAVDKAEGLSNAQQLENSHGNTERLSRPDNPIYPATGGILNLAAREGDTAEVKRLLDRGMYPNSEFLATPLIEAIQRGDVRIIQLLTAHGANANGAVKGEYGSEDRLPLLVAVRSGRRRIIRLLLDWGADPVPSS